MDLFDNIQRKCSGLIRINLGSLTQMQNFLEESLYGVYGGIITVLHFEFLNINKTLNADLYSQKAQRVRENLIKCHVRITQEK